jgi:LysR family glycine cleavage system transcriptional activator
MLRRLPSLNALKAFEATARSESVTRAAEELCVTQGAVSQQVKALEAALGINLFLRERQRLVITEAGREYLAVVRDALDRIAVGTERLVQRQTSGVLTVSTSPDFAAKWLVHRLDQFAEANPDIDLRVSAAMHHVDFAREEVDLAVRHGDGNWAGLVVVRLCSEQLFPVCSPKLVSKRNRITKASDLLKFPLLRLDDWQTWSRWFEAAGVTDPVAHGPVTEPREHADRCRRRRPGGCARSHCACGLGSDQRSSCKANRRFDKNAQNLLDRLPEGDFYASQNHNVPRVATGASSR